MSEVKMTVVFSMGNWWVNEGDPGNGRVVAMCTREKDAEDIATALRKPPETEPPGGAQPKPHKGEQVSPEREALEMWQNFYEAMERCEEGGNDGADVYDATEAQKTAIALTKAIFAAGEPSHRSETPKGGE